MSYKALFAGLIALVIISDSCKKEDDVLATSCFSDAITVRTISNAEATIQLINSDYFIVEKIQSIQDFTHVIWLRNLELINYL